ncbi:MAG: hypothetical protein IPP16_18320 [Acidimicrobiaceae bacterium]|nr:hypothetical protein [Acidimicrobiaceae bacterium]
MTATNPRTACTRRAPERQPMPLTADQRAVFQTLTPVEQVHMVMTELYGSLSEALDARRVLAPRRSTYPPS